MFLCRVIFHFKLTVGSRDQGLQPTDAGGGWVSITHEITFFNAKDFGAEILKFIANISGKLRLHRKKSSQSCCFKYQPINKT